MVHILHGHVSEINVLLISSSLVVAVTLSLDNWSDLTTEVE